MYGKASVAKILAAGGLVYARSLFIISDSVIVVGVLKLLRLLDFPPPCYSS